MKRTTLWLVLSLASLLSVVFTFAFFSRAFPIINLDLRMNRPVALEKAKALAERNGWGPAGFRQAADFDVDQNVQNYVELEAGGKDAFARMIKEKMYSPYRWMVRHFREGEQNETYIIFTPDGSFYGFHEIIPERQQGRNLPSIAARKIAESAAVAQWGVPLQEYQLVEESEELKVGGRRDHSFIYERVNAKIGNGAYRLRLSVSGDRLTEVAHFVKIPEAFDRRFQEMRSANNTIASIADIVAAVLYVLGGCFVGLFLLLRRRWVLWRAAVASALVVAGLQVLAGINLWPLEWMSYDTAISPGNFLFGRIIEQVYRFIVDFALLAISFMAAENLSRKAFPEHVQLWKVWSQTPGASVQVLGMTVSGYLLVPLFCAYQVMLYYITARFPNWWTPTDTLIEPNIFSAYFPWFNSFATALHAGFWEESLFRAVPIACGAIIGRHFGHRNRGIIAALVLQAVIFGAAHANYPNFPSYARLVELLLPSLGFGVLYIAFGLLPGIILHFAFDAVWMSLPLFIANAPGIVVDRLLIIVTVLSALLIVLYRRLQAGRWQKLPEDYRNAAWQPPAAVEKATVPETGVVTGFSRRNVRVLMLCSIIGMLLWLTGSRFATDAPALKEGRSGSVTVAREAMKTYIAELRLPWMPLTIVNAEPDYPDRFVWRKGGKKAYQELMSNGYLFPPLWMVRFVRFDGNVEERAEEFQALIADRGTVIGMTHRIPESRPGAFLSLQEAQPLALDSIKQKFGIDGASLVLVSAVPNKLPARQNWEFTYDRPRDNPLKEGQTRIVVNIDGDRVTQVYKSVYVPEEWRRAERNRLNFLGVMQSASGIVTIGLFIAGLAVGVIGWSRRKFSRPVFYKAFGALLILQVISGSNNWPAVAGHFNTSEPLRNQALVVIGYSLIAALFIALNVGLINGFIERWRRNQPELPGKWTAIAGFGAGTIMSGILAVAARLYPSYDPLWPHLAEANTFSPFVGVVVGALADYIRQGTVFMLVFAVFDRITDGGRRRIILFLCTALFLGMSLAGSRSADSLGAWVISGALLALGMIAGYQYIFRHSLSLVPAAVAGISALSLARQGTYDAFAGALPGYAAAVIAVLAAGWYWCRLLQTAPMDEQQTTVQIPPVKSG